VGLAGTACGEADEDTGGVDLPPESAPIAGCEQYDYAGCDVLEASCRENVMGLVSCLRGSDPGELPPVRVITAEEYRTELETDVVDAEPVDDRYARVLEWLDLAAPGGLDAEELVDAQVEDVAAYYSPESQEIVVIAPDASPVPPDYESEMAILAHETVHALQDQELDLAAAEEALPGLYDPWLAFRSTIEGEAVLYETMIRAATWSLDLDDLDLDRRFGELCERTLSEVSAAPTPIIETFYWFPYTYGARYVNAAYADGGSTAVHALTEAPPPSTLAMLAASGADVAESEPLPGPPPGAAGADADVEESLGSWLLMVALIRGEQSDDAQDLAHAWRADRLWIYGTEGAPEAVWQIRLATEADAQRLSWVADLLCAAPEVAVRRSDRDVLFFMGTSALDAEAWADAVVP